MIALAISHDCDIANENTQTEPSVEFILGKVVAEKNGNYEHGKNVRLLHLTVEISGVETTIELPATEKFTIAKNQLSGHEPENDFSLGARGLSILRDWLAARYKRHAFPDNLNARLAPVFTALETSGKKHAHGVIGYWLDYQPRDKELSPDELYELWLYVVYSNDDPAYADNARQIAEELGKRFSALLKKTAKGDVDLIECEAYSEQEFTLADMRNTIQFRAEHISHRVDPPGPIV